MQTNLSESMKALPRAQEAESILRSCVHCGFCNATCPTYQLLGNELDGPRGRIYLIKAMLEGEAATAKTQAHLDTCLSCRSCETTCPSGVDYHSLLDIGRDELERQVKRPIGQRILRSGLRQVLPNRIVFSALFKLGRLARPLLPPSAQEKIPARQVSPKSRPTTQHARKVLMLEGCAQATLSPNTNAAAARVMDKLGLSVINTRQAGCCGAMDYHLNAQSKGLERARRNIDAWWPAIQDGALAIVQTASGCGAFVKEYADLLRDDPIYAERARRVSALAKDLSEVLNAEPLNDLRVNADKKVAFHCPCTLQHAQKLSGAVERILQRLGFDLASVSDGHLCCGSAGTYSITQPQLSRQLRDNKLDALEANGPARIVTANIGCQVHLDAAGRTPVSHWIELVEDALI